MLWSIDDELVYILIYLLILYLYYLMLVEVLVSAELGLTEA